MFQAVRPFYQSRQKHEVPSVCMFKYYTARHTFMQTCSTKSCVKYRDTAANISVLSPTVLHQMWPNRAEEG